MQDKRTHCTSLRSGRTPNLPLGTRCAVQTFRNAADSEVKWRNGCDAGGTTDDADADTPPGSDEVYLFEVAFFFPHATRALGTYLVERLTTFRWVNQSLPMPTRSQPETKGDPAK